MVTLYLTVVLIGCIVGVLLGMNEPVELYSSHYDESQAWGMAVIADTQFVESVDMSEFEALVTRLTAPRAVVVSWSEVLTPPLSPLQREALTLLGRAQIAQELGREVDLDGASTGRYKPDGMSMLECLLDMATPPRKIERVPTLEAPAYTREGNRWRVEFNGQSRTYTRHRDAIRGAHRMVRAYNNHNSEV